MWRNHQEDWERKKTYLIRSLFHDIPLLSPVQEEQESDSTEPFRHSPLPPLIIEKLPSKHDHPPKFYEELEKKMIKLYKKLFEREESSSVEDDFESSCCDIDIQSVPTVIIENDEIVDPNSTQSVSDDSESVTESRLKSKSLSEELTTDETNTSLDTSLSSSSRFLDIKEEFDNEAIPILNAPSSKGDIVDINEENLSSSMAATREITEHLSSPIIKSKSIGWKDQGSGSSQKSSGTPNQLKAASVSDNNSSTSSEINSDSQNENSKSSHRNEGIEIMRRQIDTSPSFGSLQNNLCQRSLLSDCMERKRPSMEMHPEANAEPRSLAGDLSKTSTSYSLKFSDDDESDILAKRARFENIAIQTSSNVEDKNISWENIKNNFFVGIPKIFKLCSCKNHSCGDNAVNT